MTQLNLHCHYFAKTGKHKEDISNSLWSRLNLYLAAYRKTGDEKYINALKQLGADKELKLEVLVNNNHKNTVYSVSFSPDGRYLASGSYDKTIKLWDVKTWRCIKTFEGH